MSTSIYGTNRSVCTLRTIRYFMTTALFLILLLSQAALGQQYPDRSLVAPNGQYDDQFGSAVAISGDVAVVASERNCDVTMFAGTVYVFREQSGTWNFETQLFSHAPESIEWFGTSVAIDGDVIVVGARGSSISGTRAGAAYVFRWDNGAWLPEDVLYDSEPYYGDRFGTSVAISNDVIVVGATGDDKNGNSAGAAHVFRNDGSSVWNYEAELLAADGATSDYFGQSVSVFGDVALVGAPFDDDWQGLYAGAAYLFRYQGKSKSSGSWSEEAKIADSHSDGNEQFGWSVSVWDEVALIGAPNDTDNGTDSGSAFVYRNDGMGGWGQEDKLLPEDGSAYDYFGFSVSLCHDIALIGAYGADETATDSGQAYEFQFDGNNAWNENKRLLPPADAQNDTLGYSVSLSGETALAGAPLADFTYADQGKAYIFYLVDEPTLAIEPNPMIAGEYATFTLTNGNPDTWSYLGYSFHGLGSTYIPGLAVYVDLRKPKQAGGPEWANSEGTAEWNLLIPMGAAGWDVWLQAAQSGKTSNVVATEIQ